MRNQTWHRVKMVKHQLNHMGVMRTNFCQFSSRQKFRKRKRTIHKPPEISSPAMRSFVPRIQFLISILHKWKYKKTHFGGSERERDWDRIVEPSEMANRNTPTVSICEGVRNSAVSCLLLNQLRLSFEWWNFFARLCGRFYIDNPKWDVIAMTYNAIPSAGSWPIYSIFLEHDNYLINCLHTTWENVFENISVTKQSHKFSHRFYQLLCLKNL